ncbi:hypothetical protein LA733_0985 [Leptospira interrogans]|nr:hypothetical protein LEP1GSC053_0306 [Leptospira interrogans serovar Muenchen str. Brem 129]EMN52590.1 hypothetical protein LEP1GSC089_4406 [Leptospira interrogans serovar Autumnalis str. LP101]KLO77137.1 Uncharacterized protein AAY48_1772 [Leptospira interrogans serovar Muenchen]KWV25899.1 hypothetical protein LA733_0985 [Leptospira interrogans]KWV28427.1 hypothetical protein LA702_0870 [Leptospira interrogans]
MSIQVKILNFKKVEQLEMFQSSDHPFIQVADLIAGVLKNQMKIIYLSLLKRNVFLQEFFPIKTMVE